MLIKMTEKIFRGKWLEAVEKKNSVLCAGLDPAEFRMGRGEKGLPAGTDKLSWALQYIEAIASYCAALKPNMQYWKKHTGGDCRRKSDMDALVEITAMAHARDLVVIDDSKLADIGDTNDAGLYHSQDKSYDAVTFSPFAGNLQEAAQQAHARGIRLISMCLMSNPEYEREKNAWKDISDEFNEYPTHYIETIRGKAHVKQYMQLAHDAQKFGVDGIVIGAPSKDNHIKDYEIKNVREYVDDKMLVLLPGVGAQGGEADSIWKYFDKNNVIVNVGRSLMLPKGSMSTPQDQAETAKKYRDMLNELREKI